MPWVRIDDSFLTHPKALTAGKDGRALWLAGLLYSARELTNGFIPTGALKSIAGSADVRPSVVKLLTTPWKPDADPLWHPVEGGWQMHDYLDYQPSAEEVQVKRRRERDRKAKARAKQGRDPDTGRITSTRNPTGTPPDVPPGVPAGHPVGRATVSQGGGAPVPYPTTNDCRDTHVSPGTRTDGTDDDDQSKSTDLDQLALAVAQARSTRLGGGHRLAWRRMVADNLDRDRFTELVASGVTDPGELDLLLDDLVAAEPEPSAATPPRHPAIAATNQPDCPRCDGTRMTLDDTGTAHPCPDCHPIGALTP